MNFSSLEFYLSGGANNADPLMSLGGVISSTALAKQSITQPAAITGVNVIEASGFDAGQLSMNFYSGTPVPSLTIAPPNEGYGERVYFFADGEYILRGWSGEGNGYLLINVTLANLPSSDTRDSLALGSPMSSLFDEITPAEATAGAVHHRCIYIKNNDATANITRIGAYIASPSEGDDLISIALDTNAGVGDGVNNGVAVTLDDEADSSNKLSGLTFHAEQNPDVAPTETVTIAPAQTIPLWIKRTVPAYTSKEIINNQFSIGVIFYADA